LGCSNPKNKEIIKRCVKALGALSYEVTCDPIFINAKWCGRTFLEQITKKHIKPDGEKLIVRGFIIYMDNDTSHLSSRKIFNKWGTEVLQTPADSPDL
jgi:hypothetical protein